MIRKIHNLITISMIVLLLTFQPFLNITIAFAEEGNTETPISNLNPNAIVVTEDDEQVALFEEQSEDSDVILYLNNNDEITILEDFNQFYYVEYVEVDEDESKELINGYIIKDYIEQINLEENVDIDSENGEIDNPEIEDESDQDGLDNEASSDIDEDGDEDESVTEAEFDDESSSSISTFSVNQVTLYGFALKDKTHVYKSRSRDNGSHRTYNEGVKLKFKTLNNDWYEATVKINGKWETGYIHTSDVEVINDTNQQTLYGVALQNPTHIFSNASTNSRSLKSYSQGTILKYKTLSANWYEATVRVNGKWETGYIHKNHVENSITNQETLYGIATNSPTRVFEKASTSSKSLRSYSQGSILKYKTFSNNWYEATVRVNGKWETGYIHKNHVENSITNQETLYGIATNSPTRVFEKASTNSKSLRSYSQGRILKYKTFSSNWYEATVRVNGKWETGYIHKNHVENSVTNQQISYGIALKKPTHVYKYASKNSASLRSYKEGRILKYKTFSTNWYEATVKINGEWKTGYIHKSDVGNRGHVLYGYAQFEPTNVYSDRSKQSSVLRTYDKGTRVKYRIYDNNWYSASVKINGEWKTGYFHMDDVKPKKPNMSTSTRYNLSLDEAIEIQMKQKAQTDKREYAWVSKSYIDSDSRVTATALNVRTQPTTNKEMGNKILGTLSKGTKVDIIDEKDNWYAIKYSNNAWVHAVRKDIAYYLDPNNFIKDQRERFQFLDLSRPSGATRAVLNNYLKGKGILSGQAKAFMDAAVAHGVNEIYLISHSILETGHGTSKLASGVRVGKNAAGEPTLVKNGNEKSLTNVKTVYNVYGIGAFDSCPLDCGAIRAYIEGWDTVAKAIKGGAAFIGGDYIKAGQNTLYKMRWNPRMNNGMAWKQYATDIGWASKQVHTMYNLYQEIGFNNPILDIPQYNK